MISTIHSLRYVNFHDFLKGFGKLPKQSKKRSKTSRCSLLWTPWYHDGMPRATAVCLAGLLHSLPETWRKDFSMDPFKLTWGVPKPQGSRSHKICIGICGDLYGNGMGVVWALWVPCPWGSPEFILLLTVIYPYLLSLKLTACTWKDGGHQKERIFSKHQFVGALLILGSATDILYGCCGPFPLKKWCQLRYLIGTSLWKNTAGLWVTMVRWYLEAIYIEAVVSWYNQKNGGLEDDFPFQGGDFQVPCYFCGGVNDTCCRLLFLFKHPNMELQQKKLDSPHLKCPFSRLHEKGKNNSKPSTPLPKTFMEQQKNGSPFPKEMWIFSAS